MDSLGVVAGNIASAVFIHVIVWKRPFSFASLWWGTAVSVGVRATTDLSKEQIFMPYIPFHEKFPEIARKETRSLHVL